MTNEFGVYKAGPDREQDWKEVYEMRDREMQRGELPWQATLMAFELLKNLISKKSTKIESDRTLSGDEEDFCQDTLLLILDKIQNFDPTMPYFFATKMEKPLEGLAREYRDGKGDITHYQKHKKGHMVQSVESMQHNYNAGQHHSDQEITAFELVDEKCDVEGDILRQEEAEGAAFLHKAIPMQDMSNPHTMCRVKAFSSFLGGYQNFPANLRTVYQRLVEESEKEELCKSY